MTTIIEKKRTKLNYREALMSSDNILKNFIAVRNNKSLKDLKGKISFKDDYDYKLMRK